MYLVVDNAFNRTNYPGMIGSWHFRPPSYAGVKYFPLSSARVIEQNEMSVTIEKADNVKTFNRIKDALMIVRVGAAEASFAVIRELDFATPFIANYEND